MLRVHFYNVPPVDVADGIDRVIDIWTTADGRFMIIREDDGVVIDGAVILSRDGVTTVPTKTLPVMDNDHLRNLHRLLSEGMDFPGYSVLPVLVAEIEAREIGYLAPRVTSEIAYTFEERMSAALRRVKNALKHGNDAQRRELLLALVTFSANVGGSSEFGDLIVERDAQGVAVPSASKVTK